MRSREAARTAVEAGWVTVRGTVATKPATMVDAADPIVVDTEDDPGYASRGAYKLLGALEAFPVQIEGARCLDAGASTGGFTDVLLRGGAREVVAVDVGYGQLVWRLRDDARVVVHDRTNVRTLTPDIIGGPVDVVVADLSFISLRLVLPALIACVTPDGDVLVMVKPQFEVGREALGSGGVVRDPQVRARCVYEVASFAYDLGWGLSGVVASPLPGPSGNVEYFCWLRHGGPAPSRSDIDEAVEAGP